MITPRFRLTQTETSLVMRIEAPFSRVADADVFMDGRDFRFHAAPYYLRLHLPGDIVEDDRASATFDADANCFLITCSKVEPGRHFEGLELLSQLMRPPGRRGVAAPPSITTVSSSDVDLEEADESEPEFDWFTQQPMAVDEDQEGLSLAGAGVGGVVGGVVGGGYGFGGKHGGLFKTLADELRQVIDAPDPDAATAAQRRTQRLAKELADFDPEHYLADHFETYAVEPLLEHGVDLGPAEWSDEERQQLVGLPRKDFLLDGAELQSTYLGLVDVLLACCYDDRTTQSEPTVESAWTVAKLSGTLSWLEVFGSVKDVVECFLRRSLCYPLHRNWRLSLQVVVDCRKVLAAGRKAALRPLLRLRRLLDQSEPRYLLNQLYVDDYCVWIQRAADDTLRSLADALAAIEWTKDDLADLRLTDLERAAEKLLAHADDSDSSDSSDGELDGRMARMSLNRHRLPTDLQVAARAARLSSSSSSSCSSSSSSSSALDSDDLSSSADEEEDDGDEEAEK